MAGSVHPRQLASALALVVVLLASMVVVSPALGSTAELVDLPVPFVCKPVAQDDPCTPPPPDTALVYQGGREGNRVTVEGDGGGIRISDLGAVIEAGRGCSRVDDHSVSCSQPTHSYLGPAIFVATGAGDDRVRVTAGFSDPAGTSVLGVGVDGGSGDDVLVGGPGPDWLFGGRGVDRLRGGAGDDRLYDASPRDFLPGVGRDPFAGPWPALFRPAGRARDSYDGGTGRDTVSYEERVAKLRINLSNSGPVAGARGERDAIRRVENAIGGDGDDRIAGNRRANQLIGGRGDDLLSGHRGDDGLEGRQGNDVLRGGPGNDSININFPNAPGADRISCGSGSDFVPAAYLRDFLTGDCEKISFYPRSVLEDRLGVGVLSSLLPLRRGRSPRVLSGSWGCSPDAVCQAKAELRVRGPGRRGGTAPPRGTLLGSVARALTGNAETPFELSLSADGLRLLRRHRSLRARITIASQYLRAQPLGYTTLLGAP